MTDSDNISFQEESEENMDVFSEGFERALLIDDFVWVENIKPKMEIKDDQKQPEIITNSIVTVLPYKILRESGGDRAHSQIENNNEKKSDNKAVVTSDLDKELLVEQQYWDKYGSVAKKMNTTSKYPTSNSKTLKEHKKKNIAEITSNWPSYYQFDKVTTAILETFQNRKYLGSYLNVVGRGLNSVVIRSHTLPYPHQRLGCPYRPDLAVKVYKLSKDEEKNYAIKKRAQREFDHLIILRCRSPLLVPYVMHNYKNVTIMSFVGDNQKPAPSINSLPLEHSKAMYDIMVMQLRMLYKNEIVHGKLSPENVRIWRNRPYILGWSHSVPTDHPQALKKLMRDCHFVTRFFERRHVQVKPTLELFEETTCDKISQELYFFYGRSFCKQDQQGNPNRKEHTCRPLRNCRFK